MNISNISNISNITPHSHTNLFSDTQQAHLEALKNVVKILYDDKLSLEIIKYIINLKGQPAEEEKMAEALNLKFDSVRQSLTKMGNDGILASREFKRKKEKEEEDSVNVTGSNINPQPKKYSVLKKSSTFEWEINETFYNIIKIRFEELKRKFEKKLEYMSKEKFECPKCKRVYELDEVAHIGYVCKQCEDRPKLLEIHAEDVSMLRKRCNEIIMMLSEQFMIADKSGSGFQFMQQVQAAKQTAHKERKTVNNLNTLKGSTNDIKIINQMDLTAGSTNEIIIAPNLEDPEIEENLNIIKRDPEKLKKFKELVEFYSYK